MAAPHRGFNEWTSAAETAPGRIQVLLPDGHKGSEAVIVTTADQWDEMGGDSFAGAVNDVKRTLLALRPNEHFAVYCLYRLEPSTEAMLPQEPPFTPEPGGKWHASPTKRRLEGRPGEDRRH